MVPTWDLVLLVFLGASLVYGFLMGREKVIITLLGAYVGLVIANQWGASAFAMLSQENDVINSGWMSGNLSIFIVKVILFAAVLLLIATKGGLMLQGSIGGGGLMGFVVQAGYSVLNAALIAASILNFLPDETKQQVIDGSFIAAPLVNFYSWLLILPLLFMIVASFISRSE
ncbi:hypothetical protein JXA59_03205 [Patescibacteria group bacterium]|nr:hypothetical protein [Patescibacteria group bacterium]